MNRLWLAEKYCKGKGLEIGPGDSPWPNPNGANFFYTDKGAKTSSFEIMHDDAETLSIFQNDMFDFVVASHVLEHLENPIGAIKNWLRVLKAEGTIIMVIPDKRFTFDATRKKTGLPHLMNDFGDHFYRRKHRDRHWIEFASETMPPQRSTEALTGEPDLGCHYHVFDVDNLLDMLTHIQYMMPFQIVVYALVEKEIFVVLRKRQPMK